MYEARQNKEKVSRTIGKSMAHMSVLQRAKVPLDFDVLVNKTHKLKEKIELLGEGSDTPMNKYIINADVWAKETKNAAERKYTECIVALNEYTRNISGFEMSFAPTANANPDIKTLSSLGGTNYEVKHVSGQKDQIAHNIKKALNQLKEHSPSENNIAVINISQDCFLYIWFEYLEHFNFIRAYELAWDYIREITKRIICLWPSNYSVKLYHSDIEKETFTGKKILLGNSFFPANIAPLIPRPSLRPGEFAIRRQ